MCLLWKGDWHSHSNELCSQTGAPNFRKMFGLPQKETTILIKVSEQDKITLDGNSVLRRVDTPLHPVLMNIKSLTWNESILKAILRGINKMCAWSYCWSYLRKMMYTFLWMSSWNITSQNKECDAYSFIHFRGSKENPYSYLRFFCLLYDH